MYVNESGYAELFDINPEIIRKAREDAQKSHKHKGALCMPFSICAITGFSSTTSGYPERHPAVSREDQMRFQAVMRTAEIVVLKL